MFHFGFSYVGLIYLFMLFIPNTLWAKHKPKDYDNYAKNERKIYALLERIGEILVCIFSLIFSDFNIHNSWWIIVLGISFFFMVLYEIYWIRYFRSSKTMKDFYSSILGIPVAGATLPILGFFFLGIYGSNIFLILSAVILGIGHIGIHFEHKRECCSDVVVKKRGKKILKCILLSLIAIPVSVCVFMIGVRNVKYISYLCEIIPNGAVEDASYSGQNDLPNKFIY